MLQTPPMTAAVNTTELFCTRLNVLEPVRTTSQPRSYKRPKLIKVPASPGTWVAFSFSDEPSSARMQTYPSPIYSRKLPSAKEMEVVLMQ